MKIVSRIGAVVLTVFVVLILAGFGKASAHIPTTTPTPPPPDSSSEGNQPINVVVGNTTYQCYAAGLPANLSGDFDKTTITYQGDVYRCTTPADYAWPYIIIFCCVGVMLLFGLFPRAR